MDLGDKDRLELATSFDNFPRPALRSSRGEANWCIVTQPLDSGRHKRVLCHFGLDGQYMYQYKSIDLVLLAKEGTAGCVPNLFRAPRAVYTYRCSNSDCDVVAKIYSDRPEDLVVRDYYHSHGPNDFEEWQVPEDNRKIVRGGPSIFFDPSKV